jgi:hypothetical protein
MNVEKPPSSLRRLARSQWSGAVLFQAQSNLYLVSCVALLLAFTELLAQFHLRDVVQADFGLEISPWLVLLGFFVAARYSLQYLALDHCTWWLPLWSARPWVLGPDEID